MNIQSIIGTKKNFIFIGEAGSGKSELALNFAVALHELGLKPVHFFDMDMTKPLFRSRDKVNDLSQIGVHFHFQEQFYDAPTTVGGTRVLMKDPDVYTVLDVGGDYIGARSIGGLAPQLNSEESAVYYVLNAFRPWSYDIEHIDQTMGKILGMSHISLPQLQMINNTNRGFQTTAEEFISGSKKMEKIMSPFASIAISSVRQELYSEVKEKMFTPLFPLKLYLTYPWSI